MSDDNVFKTKPMASSVLFFNDKGEMLIVKPSYRDYWLMPGGGVELNEFPLGAAIREVKEELGLTKELFHLVAVDYVGQSEKKFSDSLVFIRMSFVTR
ncbi:MAG: hypothetical protein A3H57_00940 [Candidatus Taylorbacteria bacterium RIFCSPLOWO2_02_FULL_43_11]|uniref:Nudix hydrolase domain-containing protein n=1 Tax=Candidatus Taylorbacteria bacterium RIFCSPHIGHO2_02_FULL_43_32b TaxID=1802306 RepID=A0A1G2MJG5_9BACT|nr:MAG: hypothetical protein A2743_03980 [Candidatus Taylorbacteria bacterium RIFCSPHIGHO2_01_FULL_43_47]OHA23998.1 MAG: hypothetical protein A3C72_02540 [Candidatus Taylorbacteria bacterium RIFCSPHIGHO2_02_FULL_43_32b]OHA31016.1 MAG: hypothetical protein A3B08_03050 [Candidatus Taylorbacteria bacterium RIFCSPLOWO2_01_FULL_43_44]OHA37699.1 MAG: hypothetical protein A3H57_00940 [Candidatus Taylorbacteria bacterium RIFCSPLOWO2_02_FULL_43_11]